MEKPRKLLIFKQSSFFLRKPCRILRYGVFEGERMGAGRRKCQPVPRYQRRRDTGERVVRPNGDTASSRSKIIAARKRNRESRPLSNRKLRLRIFFYQFIADGLHGRVIFGKRLFAICFCAEESDVRALVKGVEIFSLFRYHRISNGNGELDF